MHSLTTQTTKTDTVTIPGAFTRLLDRDQGLDGRGGMGVEAGALRRAVLGLKLPDRVCDEVTFVRDASTIGNRAT